MSEKVVNSVLFYHVVIKKIKGESDKRGWLSSVTEEISNGSGSKAVYGGKSPDSHKVTVKKEHKIDQAGGTTSVTIVIVAAADLAGTSRKNPNMLGSSPCARGSARAFNSFNVLM